MNNSSHISRVKAARFDYAVRQALKLLLSESKPFKITDVIQRAKYEDGSNVGKATIYAKRSDGTRVHANLLADITSASARSISGNTRRENSSVVDKACPTSSTTLNKQLVEQESKIHELESTIAAMGHQVRSIQENLFVALTTLNKLTRGSVLRVVRPLRELENLFEVQLIDQLRRVATELADQCCRLSHTDTVEDLKK